MSLSYFDIYRGAGLSNQTTKAYGLGLGQAGRKRGILLADLVNQGKMPVTDLSPADAKAAGENLDKTPHQAGFLGSIFKPIESVVGDVAHVGGNLGSDIFNFSKGLPGGALGAVDYALGPLWEGPAAFKDTKKIDSAAKSIKDSYEYTYGGKGTDKNFFQRVAEHPLGPILDALTVASLGAGGAARLGARGLRNGTLDESHPLVRMNNTKRAPLPFDVGRAGENAAEGKIQLPSIARHYSTRPLRKTLQIIADKAGDRFGWIQDVQRKATTNASQRLDYSIKETQVLGDIKRKVIDPMVPVLKDMDESELRAFDLMNRGITTPEAIDAYQNRVRESIAGNAPEGTNLHEKAGLLGTFGNAQKLAETRAYLPRDVEDLILNPEQSPALMKASEQYRALVDEHVRPHLEDEHFQAKARELLNELQVNPVEGMAKVEEAAPASPVAPLGHNLVHEPPQGASKRAIENAAKDEGIYVDDLFDPPPAEAPTITSTPQSPSSAPSAFENFEPHPFADPTIMPTEYAKGFEYQARGAMSPFTKEGWFRKSNRALNEERLSIRNIFQESTLGFRPNADPLVTGLHRPDARSYVDFLAKHHRDMIEKAYSESAFAQWAAKDNNGEIKYYKTQQEVDAEFGHGKDGPNYVLTQPVYPIHWFNREENVADFVGKLQDRGFDVNSPELMAAIGAEAEDAVIDATFAARKMPGVAVPREVVDYQVALENASKASEYKLVRARAKAMNMWRAATLAFMPRWALNTAVGSVVMTSIKGVGPQHYLQAKALGQEFWHSPEMAGVELGSTHGMELLENKAQGVGERAMGVNINPVTGKIMGKVQAIEDYFRRASMIQSLDHEAKRMLNENGSIIRDFEMGRGPRTTEEYIDFVHSNPEAVRRALEDVNRFSYNFSTMGPFERRVLRQIIPFWGWYKFITGFAYRLPIDYPGRTLILARIGEMGDKRSEQLLGKGVPEWMKGVIPLGINNKGVLTYLSTMGLNPLSNFANPLGPDGAAAGTLSLGQLAPDIQAVLSGFGVDTMRGGQTPISPVEGIGQDFFGSLIKDGKEVDASQVAPLRRFIGTLARSAPEVRILERFAAGGRSVYPESIPFPGLVRPMATKPETRTGGSVSDLLEQVLGVAPKPYNLKSNQEILKKRAKYAGTRAKKARKNLEQGLKR